MNVEEDGELLFFCLPTMVIKIEKSWTKIMKRSFAIEISKKTLGYCGNQMLVWVELYSELLKAKKSNQEVIVKLAWKKLT